MSGVSVLDSALHFPFRRDGFSFPSFSQNDICSLVSVVDSVRSAPGISMSSSSSSSFSSVFVLSSLNFSH